jgi:excinuclease ABC subunit A
MEIESYMRSTPCPACHGDRLKKDVLAVTVGGVNISDFCKLSISRAVKFVEEIVLSEKEQAIAHQIFKEIKERLGFLNSVGLSYLTLARWHGDLIGRGEPAAYAWPPRSALFNGVIYILDEPSIGLTRGTTTSCSPL